MTVLTPTAPRAATTILAAHNLSKRFGETHALQGASLSIDKGEVLAIMGPSGSGKSTLLHALAGIIGVDDGKVLYNSRDLRAMSDDARSKLRRTEFGFVFQFGQLVPELSVLENVALPLLFGNVQRKTAFARAVNWLSHVELSQRAHHLPGQLSGGEVQRATIARAMVIEPTIIFADEPTGALDTLSSQHVMELMVGSAKSHDTTVVLVTHEPSVAAFADREVIVRDGHVVGTAQPTEVMA